MNSEDLIRLYDEMKGKYGKETYRHVSEVLKKAKEIHRKDFINSVTAKRAESEGRTQFWRIGIKKGNTKCL